MSQNVSEIEALVQRIERGELTKKEAGALIGQSYPHFCVTLKRHGLIDRVRTPRASAKYDTEAMEAAVQEATTTLEKTSLKAIARKHGLPDSQYAAFAMRVLHRNRSRMKADLAHDQVRHSGAAAGG